MGGEGVEREMTCREQHSPKAIRERARTDVCFYCGMSCREWTTKKIERKKTARKQNGDTAD